MRSPGRVRSSNVLEVFDFNKARVRYIITQRREAREPGIGVWHPFDPLANTGSLPYCWTSLRNPLNDEYYYCGIQVVADNKRVALIRLYPMRGEVFSNLEVLMRSSATSALH